MDRSLGKKPLRPLKMSSSAAAYQAPTPKTAIQKRCAACGSLASQKFSPFCSAKCQYVDLHQWLTETHTIPDDDDEKNAFDETL